MKNLLGLLAVTTTLAFAQVGTIRSGTTIPVRTNDYISANVSDGQIFTGVVTTDVADANGNAAIPRGSTAELMVRRASNNRLVLDLESINVNGQRYGVVSDTRAIATGSTQQKPGLGSNKRTAEYVGGGALLGTILGAIAGGGRGAAIGAAAGAGAGAGAQVLTRGKRVNVPAESVITFRLQQPLQVGWSDYGVDRNGRHYHPLGERR